MNVARPRPMILLLGGFALLSTTACDDPASESEIASDSDARHPLGKADAAGSCFSQDGESMCGGQSEGLCWCDDLCEGYGDCCADKTEVCDAPPPPPPPPPTNSCESASDCSGGHCILGTCMAVDDADVPAQVVPHGGRTSSHLQGGFVESLGFQLYFHQSWTPWHLDTKQRVSWQLAPGLHGSDWSTTIYDHGGLPTGDLLDRYGDGSLEPLFMTDDRRGFLMMSQSPWPQSFCTVSGVALGQTDAVDDGDGRIYVAAIVGQSVRLCTRVGGSSSWITVRPQFVSPNDRIALRTDGSGKPEIYEQRGGRVYVHRQGLGGWTTSEFFTSAGTHAHRLIVLPGGAVDHMIVASKTFGSDPAVGNLHIHYLTLDKMGGIVTEQHVTDSHAGELVDAGLDANERLYVAFRKAAADGNVPVDVARVADGAVAISTIGSYERTKTPSYFTFAVAPDGSMMLAWVRSFGAPIFVRTFVPS